MAAEILKRIEKAVSKGSGKGVLVAAIISVGLILFLISLGVYSSVFYENPILYFASAVIQAYAALIAVPFTIWVIYMQSRYGAVIVRLFLKEIVLPFVIFGVVTAVSAITIALSRTEYANLAYMAEVIVALVFIPPLITYIVRLMITGPEDVIKVIEQNVRRKEEFISLTLHILRLYMLESYPDEEAVNRTLRKIVYVMRDVTKLDLYPDIWHRFRDFLKTVVVETTYLPDKYYMSKLMTQFMKWFIVSNKYRIARAFLRYYRHVALKYMEERLPSDVIEDMFLKPTLMVLKEARAGRSLLTYALEQTDSLLRSIERLGIRGDLTSREVCKIAELVEEYVNALEGVRLFILDQRIARIKRKFACIIRKPRIRRIEIREEKEQERAKEGKA